MLRGWNGGLSASHCASDSSRFAHSGSPLRDPIKDKSKQSQFPRVKPVASHISISSPIRKDST